MTADLTLTRVRPMGGPETTLHVANGMISHTPAPGAAVVDGGGCIALPGFVDAHMHLDKTLWGLPWRPHSAGKDLADKIANEARVRAELGVDVEAQALKLIRQASRNGTTHIRTHVDVTPALGLANIEALLRAKDAAQDIMDIQIVAFPQTGLLAASGTAELIEQAIRLGADHVGGIDPQVIDGDADASIRTIFEIADRTGTGIDIHHHEENDPGADTLDKILDAVRAFAMQGRVTISHAFCIGMVAEARMQGLLDRIRNLDVALMTHAPGYKAFPPLPWLKRHGVRACSGSDGVRDVWSPYGNADMLERAMILGYRSNFRRDDEIEYALHLCTAGGADVLGIPDYGLDAGNAADLVLVDAETVAEAVVSRPGGRTVIKRGRAVQRD